MNYLAHIYLNGDDPEHQIGGFIGDFVKGDFSNLFTPKIEYGIKRHRIIDRVADYVIAFQQSRARIDQKYSRFSGIFIDIFYDHFLAKNWDMYHQTPLAHFSSSFFETINTYQKHIPQNAFHFIQYMKSNHLFDFYVDIKNIEHVLIGMSRRMKRANPLGEGRIELEKNYDKLEMDFHSFMSEINSQLDELSDSKH